MGKPKKQKTKSANGTGSLWTDPRDGSLYGVVTWIENHPVTGKPRRCRRMRKAVSGNKTEAYQHVRDLLAELNLGGAAHIDARKVTLADLARHHFEHHLTPVERDADGVKRSGLASWEDRRRMCQLAVDYFGPQKLITTITAAEVRRYRLHRLKVPLQANYRVGPADENGVRELHQDTRKDPETGQPKVRSITTVHKEIGTLRRMLNHAVEEGWLPLGNPIGGKKGTGLINPAEEPKQTVIASTDEEARKLHWPHYRVIRDRIGALRGWPPIRQEEYEREIEHGSLYIGSPETVARKIASAVKALGVGRFDLIYTAGAQPISARMRAVELYGTKVIPMVRDILGG